MTWPAISSVALRGLVGQRLHLGGDDRKALAGIAGAGRLDRGVERQQIGLAGDVGDDLDDVADLLRGRGQSLHPLVALAGLAHRVGDHAGHPRDLLADVLDRGPKLALRSFPQTAA